MANPFGAVVDTDKLDEMEKYVGKTKTQEDRAREAMNLINEDDKNTKAESYVEKVKAYYGTGVSTLCLVYNATGDTIYYVADHDWSGFISRTPYPTEIGNGQWAAFQHVHNTRTSICALLGLLQAYREMGAVDSFQGRWHDIQKTLDNSGYTESSYLQVYNSIIEKSGRASIPKQELASPGVGIAVLVVSAGLMVWDIFTAEHKAEAMLSNSLSAVKDIAGFGVQVVVDWAVMEALADVEIGVLYVSLAAFVAGTVVGLLFAAAAGFMIDLILGSGGKTAPSVENLKYHTAKMPDGMAFAFQIAHDG